VDRRGDYRRLAWHCLEMAEGVLDANSKAALLRMAQTGRTELIKLKGSLITFASRVADDTHEAAKSH